MARPHSCGEYPFLTNATVQKFAGKATARMGETKLRKLLETRLQSTGYASMGSLPVTELQDLTQLGSGTLLMAEMVGLARGEAIRAINQPNVHHIAKQLVAKGFNPEFPLTVGVLPVKNSSEKEFRATLTGGAHRLAAVLSCEVDFTRYLAGEETLYDWSASPYSESRPPEWLQEVPTTLHFYGGVEAFLKISVAIGHAQNNLSAGSAPTTYYDKIFYIRGMREQGWNQAEIIANFPPSVKGNHQKKLLGTCTALCSGLFPAVAVLADYYKTYFEHSMMEFFTADRFSTAPAKATRKVFMEGKHTGNNANRAYGLRVFSTLALKYQAISKDGAEPSLLEGMATRVHTDSPLSQFAGPYARLLEETLDVVVTAVTERHLREVLCLRTKAHSSDPADFDLSTSMTPLDIGLTIISKLLAEHTFLPPHSGTVSEGFPIPEGEALQKPVCDAICGMVDHAVSVDAVRRCLYMGAESVTETDDEEEEEGSDCCHGPGKGFGDGEGGGVGGVRGKVVLGGDGDGDGDGGAVGGVRRKVGGVGVGGEGGEGGEKSGGSKNSERSVSNNGDGDNSLPGDDGEDAGNGACLMGTAQESEAVRDTTIREEGSRAPRTLCYTGLSRLVGQAIPNALQYADTEDVRIHTVFVYEDDPKLGKVAAQLEALHASGSLHATPVVVAVPSAEECVTAGGGTMTGSLDSEDDAAETDFKFRMASLQSRMEEWLGKECQSLTILAHVSDSAPASALNRGKASNAVSGVDSAVNGSWKQPIMVFAFRDAPLQKLISPGDAAGPWSKDDSGYSFTLQGKEIASFAASDARTRDLQRMAIRTQRGRTGTGLLNIMSPEVYKSLLRIFHLEGTAVLSTYDPCGVVQAAAVTLDRHCLTFLGRSTKTSLQSMDIDGVPLLGARKTVRAISLRRVVGDHKGNVLTEGGLARSDTGNERKGLLEKEAGDGKGSGGKEAGNEKGSATKEAGKSKGSEIKGVDNDKDSGRQDPGSLGGKEAGNGKASGRKQTGNGKGSGGKQAGSRKGSGGKEAGSRKGTGTKKTGIRKDKGTKEAPRKRPGSSCSPEMDHLAPSRKRPNTHTGSSSVRVAPGDSSSETAS